MMIESIEFKKIVREYSELSKLFVSCNIQVNYQYTATYSKIYNASYSSLVFKNVDKMYQFSKKAKLSAANTSFLKSNMVQHELLTRMFGPEKVVIDVDDSTARRHKTVKLIPQDTPHNYRPSVINIAPFEITEGDHTYRVLNFTDSTNHGMLISRDDDKLYDYLDAGFFIKKIEVPVKGRLIRPPAVNYIVANVYDVNVAHIFAMCTADSKLVELLQHGCFINGHSAEMLRLKMFKKMSEYAKKAYLPIAGSIDEDYRRNSTLIVAGKLAKGELEKVTINNVIFTKTSASYEQVSIEAENLMDVLYKELNFNSEFDIYTVTSIYAKHIEAVLDAKAAGVQVDGKLAEGNVALTPFKINNIEISASVLSTFQRYINKIRINKDEIAKAIHRASCMRSEEDYKLFLKSICRMSIKWHDVVANGMPVKIHSSMTREEYSNPIPGPAAPVIRFCIDPQDKSIKLHIKDDRTVAVHFSRLIKKVETLNRKTNRGTYPLRDQVGYYRRHGNRDYSWCISELVGTLLECCTFEKVSKDENGVETKTQETSISREDLVELVSVVDLEKQKVIERSKQFLETAVKLTGATLIEFMGNSAYHVKGGLREYVVVIKNAKVYDYETKQYRCIVNDRHYAGAGYDDIAARLLALKNDSLMQQHISTLRGEAQPGAENIHNDYSPERDTGDTVSGIVSDAIARHNTVNA
jgi:hypothetical protein